MCAFEDSVSDEDLVKYGKSRSEEKAVLEMEAKPLPYMRPPRIYSCDKRNKPFAASIYTTDLSW